MLELAKMRQEAFKGYYSNANQNGIDHTIEDLIYLMSETLKRTLQGRAAHHEGMVRHLESDGSLLQCCFISLNYDILIDNALIAKGNTCDIDYGIEFMNYEYPGILPHENWVKPNPENSVKLLKVHGSLNWLYCPVCRQMKITPRMKGASELAYIGKWGNPKPVCDICKGHFSPILIPPTYYKDVSNYFISSIWHAAEQVLMNCKKIIFCGYSLPDADMHIKYLLKRGTISRDGPQPEIIVLNNHEHKRKQEKRDEECRYRRLFGDRVVYRDISFQSFSKNPSIFLE